MTGLKVVDINIHVQGLNLPKEEKKEPAKEVNPEVVALDANNEKND